MGARGWGPSSRPNRCCGAPSSVNSCCGLACEPCGSMSGTGRQRAVTPRRRSTTEWAPCCCCCWRAATEVTVSAVRSWTSPPSSGRSCAWGWEGVGSDGPAHALVRRGRLDLARDVGQRLDERQGEFPHVWAASDVSVFSSELPREHLKTQRSGWTLCRSTSRFAQAVLDVAAVAPPTRRAVDVRELVCPRDVLPHAESCFDAGVGGGQHA